MVPSFAFFVWCRERVCVYACWLCCWAGCNRYLDVFIAHFSVFHLTYISQWQKRARHHRCRRRCCCCWATVREDEDRQKTITTHWEGTIPNLWQFVCWCRIVCLERQEKRVSRFVSFMLWCYMREREWVSVCITVNILWLLFTWCSFSCLVTANRAQVPKNMAMFATHRTR